jgi:hypothetical protein
MLIQIEQRVQWTGRENMVFFSLGFTMVSWCSKKQISVALSIAKAEHIALSVAVREVVWLHNPLK